MLTVYLSSTKADLQPYRDAVSEILRAPLGFAVLDSYDAATGTVRQSCLDDVSSAHAYIGILAWRYGHIPPPDENPGAASITELEYQRALETPGMARFLFLLDPAEPWPGDPQHDDTKSDPEGAGRRIRAFRERVLRDRAVLFKAQPGDLAGRVLRALTRWKAETPAESPPLRAPPLPPPRLRLPQHAFVGRQDLLQTVLEGLERGLHEFAFVYLPGVGKTALTTELIHNPSVRARFPDGVLWAHLGPDPDVRLQLRKWAALLGYGDEALENRSSQEDLAALIADAIGERRVLLVVDDVWNTAAASLFKLGGRHCAFVVTTRNPRVAKELMPTVEAVISVPKLAGDDGLALLSSLAPRTARHAPEALRRFVRRVDGLPIALVLIGNMLKARGDDARALDEVERELSASDLFAEVRRADFSEFSEADYISLDTVIEASYHALGKAGPLQSGKLPGDELRRALEALAVLRPDPAWFPVSLAIRLMGAPAEALRELADAGLIEKVRYPGDDEWHSGELRYTMHRMILEYLRLKKLSPERAQALNRQAAQYYLEQLAELEQAYQESGPESEPSASYGAMYRYENPDWQDCQDNWLYYFSQTGYDSEASLSFLKVWFDGFWWWSCFTGEGFDFCDQLLGQWEHRLSFAGSEAGPAFSDSRQRHERRTRGLELLRAFKDAYPKESTADRRGAWPEVARSLEGVCALSGLDGDGDALARPEARHVRALIDIFRAEAARFGAGDLTGAEALYREAQRLFRVDRDDWNVAWSLYHLADLFAEAGRHAAIAPWCAEALALGAAGGDHEVVALCHRLLGEAALARQDADAAAREFRQALISAYRFQVEPRPPDDYTLSFYRKIAASLAAALLRCHAQQPALARAVTAALQRRLAGPEPAAARPADAARLLEDGDAESLAAGLFPPGLAPARRAQEGGAYAEDVRARLAALDAGGDG